MSSALFQVNLAENNCQAGNYNQLCSRKIFFENSCQIRGLLSAYIVPGKSIKKQLSKQGTAIIFVPGKSIKKQLSKQRTAIIFVPGKSFRNKLSKQEIAIGSVPGNFIRKQLSKQGIAIRVHQIHFFSRKFKFLRAHMPP